MDVRNTLLESLGIRIVKISPEEVVATMPVDGRTVQPFGYLHGGATAALLETVASLGAIEYADLTKQSVFGTHLDIHHVKSAREGIVTGTATPITVGDDEQVWAVESRNEEDAVLSTGTVTVRVVPKRP
jgi:uncharacterized protein (TIGR00369 family)